MSDFITFLDSVSLDIPMPKCKLAKNEDGDICNDEGLKMRKQCIIRKKENEFFEKVWYNRHQNLKYRVLTKGEIVHPEIWKKALVKAKELEDKYGVHNLAWTDFEWGMVNGKLSALRWVLGDEWDFLDT